MAKSGHSRCHSVETTQSCNSRSEAEHFPLPTISLHLVRLVSFVRRRLFDFPLNINPLQVLLGVGDAFDQCVGVMHAGVHHKLTLRIDGVFPLVCQMRAAVGKRSQMYFRYSNFPDRSNQDQQSDCLPKVLFWTPQFVR